jgi:hypothetical protein
MSVQNYKGKKEAIFQLIICKLLLLQSCRFSQLRFSQIAERELDTSKAYGQGLFPNLKTCIDFLFFFGVF